MLGRPLSGGMDCHDARIGMRIRQCPGVLLQRPRWVLPELDVGCASQLHRFC